MAPRKKKLPRAVSQQDLAPEWVAFTRYVMGFTREAQAALQTYIRDAGCTKAAQAKRKR